MAAKGLAEARGWAEELQIATGLGASVGVLSSLNETIINAYNPTYKQGHMYEKYTFGQIGNSALNRGLRYGTLAGIFSVTRTISMMFRNESNDHFNNAIGGFAVGAFLGLDPKFTGPYAYQSIQNDYFKKKYGSFHRSLSTGVLLFGTSYFVSFFYTRWAHATEDFLTGKRPTEWIKRRWAWHTPSEKDWDTKRPTPPVSDDSLIKAFIRTDGGAK